MKHIYANGRSMAQILGLIKPKKEEETEEERAEALYKKRLSRLRQLKEADQKGGKVLSNIQMPNRVRHDEQGVWEVQDRDIPNKCNILTIPQNVALADRGMQEGRDDVASRHSDEFLRTFCGKKYEPCHGLSGGKAEGWEKDVLSNIQMSNRVRHDVETTQTNTSFIPYITSVSKQCLQPIGAVARLMALLIFVSMCLLNSVLAQSREEVGAADGLGEIKPLQIGDTIPEELWHLPLQVVNHPEGKDTITLNDYRDKKLIILDFWSTYCGTCYHTFPSTFKKAEPYVMEVALIPVTYQRREIVAPVVGKNGYLKSIEGFYTVVDNSLFRGVFGIAWFPQLIVLDDQGKLLGHLRPRQLTAEMLLGLLHKQPVVLPTINEGGKNG